MSIWAEVHKTDPTFGIVTAIIDMGNHIPEAAPPLFYIDTTGHTPAPQAGWWYDHTLAVFTSVDPGLPVIAREIVAPELWLEILTSTERAKIWALCNGETVPGVTINLENRYRLAAFRDITLTGLPFPLDHPEVVAVFDGLVSTGLFTQIRVDEILER